ncbi:MULTISPECIES: hypothetical protein [Leptotrichia]|jgi:hypothetical protein|uniref:hypothetical protein n=1 Tax=Leptotrichia TaxID=32067 RepID=UPI0003AE281C|nr:MULTISPECIES: hypothetical protein [Leptotrichia]ERL25878.1 hypothetical protein HMPREF9108_01552 [Leptotrichia sp. oral taxon 225 str. F0581]WLD75233.1 hypothetical protein QU666_05030 [Leptotrichia sp. HMT-225]
MIENKYPIFGHGQVISKQALDLLRDNPVELTELLYLDRKDGIISGFNLFTDAESKQVTVTKGIVKYGGKIFWMNEDYKFDMPEIENRYILKLNLFSDFQKRKFYVRSADFSLEILNNGENVEIKNEDDVETGFDLYNQLEINYENVENTGRKKIGEIEITRFITRVGAELRNDYNSFKDLRRDFNLLELINTKYSSKHELGTLHPKILELFGKEASKKTNLDIYDVNFYVNCLNESVERDIIIAYINLKLEMEQKNYSNEELYQYLVKILDNLGKDREIIQKKRVVPRKITIE